MTADEVQRAALLAERWHARLSRLLVHELSGRQPLILYANHPHFRQTNAVPGGIGEGTGGVTEAFKRRVVLPFGGSLAATDHVLGHELVHAFQFDMTGEPEMRRWGASCARRAIAWMRSARSKPDGRTLAFTTDRFTTDLEALSVGTFQIAAVDLETGEVRRLAGFDGAKNINPQ